MAFSSYFRQIRGIGPDLADGRCNLLHVIPRAQKHILSEPYGLLAQPIILRTAVTLLPPGQQVFRIDRLVASRTQSGRDERFLIQGRISP
jgi:hypothetical protein